MCSSYWTLFQTQQKGYIEDLQSCTHKHDKVSTTPHPHKKEDRKQTNTSKRHTMIVNTNNNNKNNNNNTTLKFLI